jgi:hypothetical protein
MISSVLFLLAGVIVCVAAVIAIFAIVEVYYLSGSRALADDGLSRGSPAPAWSLTAASGELVHSPPRAKPFQLIVFSDHSLKSFPAVAAGLGALTGEKARLEIVVLTRQDSGLVKPALETLELTGLKLVSGSPSWYGKYNVRVMPFLIFVDSGGRVRASSLVNHAWQVEKLWRLAQVDPDPAELRPAKRARRRPAGIGA